MFKHIQANSVVSLLQRLSIGLTAATIGIMVHTAQAADNIHDTSLMPIDFSNITTTKYELAVMQVLSEICPPMLNKQQKQRFYKTYNVELKNLLPTIQDPKTVMQYLSKQQDYKNILKSVRSWTLGISAKENQALCAELAQTSF